MKRKGCRARDKRNPSIVWHLVQYTAFPGYLIPFLIRGSGITHVIDSRYGVQKLALNNGPACSAFLPGAPGVSITLAMPVPSLRHALPPHSA